MTARITICNARDSGCIGSPSSFSRCSPPLDVAGRTGAGDFRYSQDRLDAPAGRAELVLTNDDVHQHDVKIQTGTKCCYEAGAKDVGGTDIISSGTTKTLVDLEAGEYVFFCSVGRHAEDGMQGRLTVAGR